jgi:hypothetical protein
LRRVLWIRQPVDNDKMSFCQYFVALTDASFCLDKRSRHGWMHMQWRGGATVDSCARATGRLSKSNQPNQKEIHRNDD